MLGGWGGPPGKQHWIWVLKRKDFHGQWGQEEYSRMKGKKEKKHERMHGSQEEGEEAVLMLKNLNCI